jgi:hypothetical protein
VSMCDGRSGCSKKDRTKRWTSAAIRSGEMEALTRRGLINAVPFATLSHVQPLRIAEHVAARGKCFANVVRLVLQSVLAGVVDWHGPHCV